MNIIRLSTDNLTLLEQFSNISHKSDDMFLNISNILQVMGETTPAQEVLVAPPGACQGASFPYRDLTQSAWVRSLFVLLYVMVMVTSLIGNLMVMWTVARNKHMQTVTNYYIVNLALCDFLVASFVLPLKLMEYTAPCDWRVFTHDALCSFIFYILPVFVFASVLTLVAISLERSVYMLYFIILHDNNVNSDILPAQQHTA